MATVNLTDIASQQAEIERRRKMAELLAQQADQPIEIQSYKGIQAPIPWTATLAKVLQGALSGYEDRQATKADQAARKQAREEASGFLDTLKTDPGLQNNLPKAEDYSSKLSLGDRLKYGGASPQALGAVLGGQPMPQLPQAAPEPPQAPPQAMPAPPVAPVQQAPLPPAEPPQAVSTMAPLSKADVLPSTADNPSRERPMAEQQNMLMQAMFSGNPYLEKLAPTLYQQNQTLADEDRTFSQTYAYDQLKRQQALEDKIAYDKLKPEERTAMQKDYDVARQGGWQGSFADWVAYANPKPLQVAGSYLGDARSPGQAGPSAGSRGIRNNNPLNLTVPADGAWDGQTGTDGKFAVFASPEAGFAAADKNLQSYAAKGISTLSGIINRWAPPNENDTAAYISTVSKDLGIDPNKPLNLADPNVRQQVLQSMSKVEIGGSPPREIKPLYTAPQKEGAEFDPDTLKFMAAQALAGDKSVFQNLGRGAQGAKNIALLRAEVMRQAKGAGLTGADMAQINANFFGAMSEARAVGSRAGAADTAAVEVPRMAQMATDAYAALPRGQFVPFNKLRRLVDHNLSSPEQGTAYAADVGLITAWARALNPQGVPREADIAKGEKMLDGAQSAEAHAAVVKQMLAEANAIRAGTREAKDALRPGGAAAPGAPQTAAAPPAVRVYNPKTGRLE